MPPHTIAGHVSAYAYIFNAFLFLANMALYAFNFRYARRQNRRLAALVQQVRAKMDGSLVEFPASDHAEVSNA